MKILQSPSPNFDKRPGISPSLIIIHGTAGSDAGDLKWCTTGEAEGKKQFGRDFKPVSYHYLILRDGAVHQLVADEMRAWHAGVSEWLGMNGCNDFAIGIGLSCRFSQGENYTDAQYKACAELVADVRDRWSIPLVRVVAHSQVSPGRKFDPGHQFHWARLFA